MIKGVLVDLKTGVKVVEIEDKLENYYKIINCNCIDIVTRKIGDKHFEIVCDDEALLKDEPVCSACGDNGKMMLFGNLFICNCNRDGELESLSDRDIALISVNVNPFYNMLMNVKY